MILYHGTTEEYAKDICNNGIKVANNYKPADFGMGFYTTPDYETARKWAIRKAISFKERPSIVRVLVDEKRMNSIITTFEDDLRWGRFVINNRNGMSYISRVAFKEHNLDARYDITYGRIADYDVYSVAERLKKSSAVLEDLCGILNSQYSFQYAFHTQNGIDCILKVTYENL